METEGFEMPGFGVFSQSDIYFLEIFVLNFFELVEIFYNFYM